MPVQLEAATERARARVGTLLKKKWHLDLLLGVGGMAAVYAATHRNKKRVAIKMLHAELSQDEAIRKRFLREGYIANTVGQRGAVAVDYDDVSEDGLAFLVMELLDGETIEQRWRGKGQVVSPREALSVVDQLLDTLAAAHAKGIIHRDLKPANLFLTHSGTVKVLDFGIARVRELSTPLTTLAGSAIGTPAFMSPEQARGRWDDVDGRSDLWAVGATLYTLLTGHFVHSADTAHETLALAATRPARSLAERRPDLHPSLIQLVDKALSYDRNARFPDATSMQQALRVSYALMEAGPTAMADPGGFPDLQAGRASRVITLRNVKAYTPGGTGQQPRARRSSRALQVACGLAVSVALLGALLWWRAGQAPSEPAAQSLPSAPPSAAPVVSEPSAAPLSTPSREAAPQAPRAIPIDELPKEPSPAPARRR